MTPAAAELDRAAYRGRWPSGFPGAMIGGPGPLGVLARE